MSLTAFQADYVRKIRILREHTQNTGFRTTRAVNTLLGELSDHDLVAVLEALPRDENDKTTTKGIEPREPQACAR
jgi:hypothetical protein